MDIAQKLDKEFMIQTYGRYDVTIDHGKGALLYDTQGREYIDFAAGIGTLSLGVADEEWLAGVEGQLKKIQHISNYYYSEPTARLAEQLVRLTGLKRAFFGNSGAEANEGAIKTARKYSVCKYGKERTTIVTLRSSFHGRTVTTLAATGQDVFHEYFYPFTEGFRYAPLNDIQALEAALTEDVCAVMAEPIQGEGGVNAMSEEYAQTLRTLCDERDILMIFDEVQTGVGRCGSMFAYETLQVVPDIVTLAKGLGGGLPIGAFVVGKKCEDVLQLGQHGTTFGGNPVICAGALKVLERVAQPEFLQQVRQKGDGIRDFFRSLRSDSIRDVRGKGLMIGIETTRPIKKLAAAALDCGVLVLTAGKDVIRLLPPLVITTQEIQCGCEKLAPLFDKN